MDLTVIIPSTADIVVLLVLVITTALVMLYKARIKK